jgi:hypothetical protein
MNDATTGHHQVDITGADGLEAAEVVAVTVKRGAKTVVLSVTLGEAKPPEPPRPEWAPIPKTDKSGPTSFSI